MVKLLFGGIALLMVAAGGLYTVPSVREAAAPWMPSFLAMAPEKAQRRGNRTARAVPVKLAAATSRDVPIYLEGVGTVKARSTVSIRSRIEGQLFEALVREGQTVKRDDVLFRLDPRPFQARLKEAEAMLARDRANHAKAVSDVKRLRKLSASGYSPRTRLDEAETLVQTFAATMRATQASIELAQLNLDYATIRSPIDGRVGSILITPGNIVKPNDNQPLLVITETKPIYVSFGVPEKYIDELRKRMAGEQLAVEVSTQSSRAIVATGELFFINNEVDASTGTIQLLATFANDDERLVPGQFAKARIRLTTLGDAVLVPSRAVQINQKGNYVWVANGDDTVELRPIMPGPNEGSDTVVMRGVAPGEKVVTDGQLRLFPGAAVQIGGGGPKGKKGGGKGKKGGGNKRPSKAKVDS